MSSYAIIEAGSKQLRVEPKDVIEIEKTLFPENQKEVSLEKVLFVKDGEKIHIGTPWVQGARILCDYLGDHRASKVIAFKYRRRKASRKKHGHRQSYSRLLVKEIQMGR